MGSLNLFHTFFQVELKGLPSDVRQFLATESPLTMMKNGFCLTVKAFFVLNIFKFLSYFGYLGKWLDGKAKVNNVKICDVKNWERKNCNTHIAQYFEKQRQSDNNCESVQYDTRKIIHKMRWRNSSHILF